MDMEDDTVETDGSGISLTVRYLTTVKDNHPRIYAYALRVSIINAIGCPDHLFVFQRTPKNNEGDAVDEFIQIASPLETEEVPEDAPDFDNNMPYYRAKEVVLWFRNMEDLELGKNKIKEDLQTLVQTYKLLDGEQDKEEVEKYE